MESWSLQLKNSTRMSCSSTEPRPTPEASVWTVENIFMMAPSRSLNARSRTLFHLTLFVAAALVRSVRTVALSAKWGINLLYHPTRPTKASTFFFVVGTGYEWMTSTLPTRGLTTHWLTTCPRYLTCSQDKAHFAGLLVSPASLMRWRTC